MRNKHRSTCSHSVIVVIMVALTLFAATACNKPDNTTEDTTSNKFQQYYIKGEQLYTQHCANCHQKNGTGLGLLYPPLNESDFVDKNFQKTLCIIRYGIKGELVVNGKSFNKEMPAIPSLTDLEIAEIATYVYNTWGRQKGLIDVKETTRQLSTCTGQ